MEYRKLVGDLLTLSKYPVLKDYVVLEVFFKFIRPDHLADTVRSFDLRYDDPVDKMTRLANPFRLHYLVGTPTNSFHMNFLDDELDTLGCKVECKRIKLTRHVVDSVVQLGPSETFEEELYRFVTHLNFNVGKIAPLLDLTYVDSTRFLPQYLRMWVYKFDAVVYARNTVGRDRKVHYGPTEEQIPVRVLRGKLAPCTSRRVVLSLNNDIEERLPYTTHLAERDSASIPLAYNPFENPLLV